MPARGIRNANSQSRRPRRSAFRAPSAADDRDEERTQPRCILLLRKLPKCDFSSWDMPTGEKCPQCGGMLFRKKGKPLLVCHAEGCGYRARMSRRTHRPSGTAEERGVSMPTIHVYGPDLPAPRRHGQAARQGVDVVLHEMKPHKMTPAHHSRGFAELVCSNSCAPTG